MLTISGLTSRNVGLSKYSDAVYGDGPNGLAVNGISPKYTSIDLLSIPKSTGFFAAVYQYPGTDKYVIAFRGTDGASDGSAGLALKNGTWDPQFDDAIDFVSRAAEVLGVPPSQIKDRIIVTGHSLGGANAQIVGQLYGLDGAAFDPAGSSRQTELPEFKLAADRNNIDPAANNISGNFRNYGTEDSWVSTETGPHVGQVEVVPQIYYPNLFDMLKAAGFGALTGNPLVFVLGTALIDQFQYKHPIGKVAESLDRLAALEDDPLINPDGSEIRVTKLDDGSWKVYDQGGQDLDAFKIVDGNLQLITPDQQIVNVTKEGFVSVETVGPDPLQTISGWLDLIQAMRSGKPLPIISSGIRLAALYDPTNTDLQGANAALGFVTGVLGLRRAIQNGDLIGATISGAQAFTNGVNLYAKINGITAEKALQELGFSNATSSTLQTIGTVAGVLNIINSLAHGKTTDASISAISMVFPWFGVFYSVTQMMSPADYPEGVGRIVTNADGSLGIAIDGYQMKGDIPVRNALGELIKGFNQTLPQGLSLADARLDALMYDYKRKPVFRLNPYLDETAVMPSLTPPPYSQWKYVFDDSGKRLVTEAEIGSDAYFSTVGTQYFMDALSRGGIAPLWEIQTAQRQAELYKQAWQAAQPPTTDFTSGPLPDIPANLIYPGASELQGIAAMGKLVPAGTTSFKPIILDAVDGDGQINVLGKTDPKNKVAFDTDTSGYLRRTAWAGINPNGKADVFLALDRDLNAQIDGGEELFSNSLVADDMKGVPSLFWVDADRNGIETANKKAYLCERAA